jgi:hypothetical protein
MGTFTYPKNQPTNQTEPHTTSNNFEQGAVYCLQPFNGKLLAGINSKVQLYRWAEKDGAPELQVYY